MVVIIKVLVTGRIMLIGVTMVIAVITVGFFLITWMIIVADIGYVELRFLYEGCSCICSHMRS